MAIVRMYSHNFVVVTKDRRITQLIFDYYRNRLSIFKFGTKGKGGPPEIDRTFASANKDRTHFRMLRESYNDFIRYMAGRGIPENTWEVEQVKMYKPAEADYNCTFPYPLREKQVEINVFIKELNPITKALFPHRVIPLQMGGGKTLIALYTAAQMKVRTMIVVSKRYIDNWINNIYGSDAKLDVDPKKVLLIGSTNDLIRAIRNAKTPYERFDYDIILARKSTVTNFIKAYVRGEKKFADYLIKVEDLYKVLGVGFLIRDEVHEEIHANANQDLHMHVPTCVNLSATLEYDDPKLDDMARLVFPLETRFNAGEWNKYINVKALRFNLQLPTKLKWSLFKKGPYSQAEFEKSILSIPQKKAAYGGFIANILACDYIPILEPGDKIAVYAYTINMCSYLQDLLQDRFPDKLVNRYVGEDEYSNLMEADIVITTPGSAGTGVDIAGLRRVLMTNAVKSSQRSFQTAGRLRELFELDRNGIVRDVEFGYFVCNDIPQHVDYHHFRRGKFRGKMKSQEEIETGYYL